MELKPVLWEREPLLASGHFQDALDPATTDIMVCMLWSRLGSPLPENFKGVDGRVGLTGSEWEFEFGLKAWEELGEPDLLVYRKAISAKITLEELENSFFSILGQAKFLLGEKGVFQAPN